MNRPLVVDHAVQMHKDLHESPHATLITSLGTSVKHVNSPKSPFSAPRLMLWCTRPFTMAGMCSEPEAKPMPANTSRFLIWNVGIWTSFSASQLGMDGKVLSEEAAVFGF